MILELMDTQTEEEHGIACCGRRTRQGDLGRESGRSYGHCNASIQSTCNKKMLTLLKVEPDGYCEELEGASRSQ
jgi:hypothetical protein